MTHGKPFELGRSKIGSRIKRSRNKISEAFLKDLAAEWEAGGPATLRASRFPFSLAPHWGL
jgi:hypothetical protein